MKYKETQGKINLITPKIKIISSNGINLKKDIYNKDLIFSEKNFVFNNDTIISKYNNTISSNIENDKNILNYQPHRNILINSSTKNFNTKESLSQDKLIQTPSNFYSIDNTGKNKNHCFTPNKKFIKKEKLYQSKIKYIIFGDIKNIPRILSGIRPTNFSKNFSKNFESIKNIKHSRNKVYPIINDRSKTKSIKKYFKNIKVLKEYLNNTSEDKKRGHHNLFTIENIYFEKRPLRNRFKLDNDRNKESDDNKYKMPLLHKKYSIKEIKYPLFNNITRKYKIINDNNDHLLEEVFKRQTLSNFNNKYSLKYKTNSNSKKENIKNLFSLLKKYKYSDKDKQTAFNKYNSMKKAKKTFNIM